MIFDRILIDGYDALLVNYTHLLQPNICLTLIDFQKVYVYHKDPFAENTPCLGLATIPLDTFLNSPKVDVDYWYDLVATSDMTERVEHSRIRLIIQYNNEMDSDFLVLPTSEVCVA